MRFTDFFFCNYKLTFDFHASNPGFYFKFLYKITLKKRIHNILIRTNNELDLIILSFKNYRGVKKIRSHFNLVYLVIICSLIYQQLTIYL